MPFACHFIPLAFHPTPEQIVTRGSDRGKDTQPAVADVHPVDTSSFVNTRTMRTKKNPNYVLLLHDQSAGSKALSAMALMLSLLLAGQ